MDLNDTISFSTKIKAKEIGYEDFPIHNDSLSENMCLGETVTFGMFYEWIKTNHHLSVETKYDDNQMWKFVLNWDEGYGTKTLMGEYTYVDSGSGYDKEKDAFDAGLQRAIYEIKSRRL
jgi:hypothetical protein